MSEEVTSCADDAPPTQPADRQSCDGGKNEEKGSESDAGATETSTDEAVQGSASLQSPNTLVTYEQLGIYSQRPRRPEMSSTQVRINTFENWPHGNTHPPAKMAEAGFYYTGSSDTVRCFHCNGQLQNWSSRSNPSVEHCDSFPHCHFIRASYGPTGKSLTQETRSKPAQLVTYEQLAIYSQRPRRPEMSSTQVRINTFENWPHGNTHPPAKMAEAGFFNTGSSDTVRCFYCNRQLQHWSGRNNSSVEHDASFPNCHFITAPYRPTGKNLTQETTASHRPTGKSLTQETTASHRPTGKNLTQETRPKDEEDMSVRSRTSQGTFTACQSVIYKESVPVQETAAHPVCAHDHQAARMQPVFAHDLQTGTQMEDFAAFGVDSRITQPQGCYTENSLWLTGKPPAMEQGDLVPENENHGIDNTGEERNHGDGNHGNSSEESSGGHDGDVTSDESDVDDDDDRDDTEPRVNDIDLGSGYERVCLHCQRFPRDIRLVCGHKNICCFCFACHIFWDRHLQNGPARCLICGQPSPEVVLPRNQWLMDQLLNNRRQRNSCCGCLSRTG